MAQEKSGLHVVADKLATSTTTPTDDQSTEIQLQALDNSVVAGVQVLRGADGNTSATLTVKGITGATSSLGITISANGSISTSAPTPATSSNNTNIATTAYVNNKIQVVSALPSSPDSNVFYFVTG